MATTSVSFIASVIEEFKQGREEERRERKARQLDYQTKLIENFNFSPREFYVLLGKNLDKREVPGLRAELVQMYESIVGSAKRLYLTITRERYVYYICAAPYGTGFFFSWRLVDERRPAKWYHIVGAFFLISVSAGLVSALFTGPLKGLWEAFGFNAQNINLFNNWITSSTFLVTCGGLWSAMRLASLPGYENLAISIEKVPLIGRVFERFYRPDTYYRQDSQKMYQKVFDFAVAETIDALTTPQGTRIKGRMEGSPLVADLHRM